MIELERYFWEVYLNRPWDDRHYPVLVLDDVVAVNFASMFDRNYATMGADQLIYQVHKVGHNKRFIFVCEDGVNPVLSGITEIIKQIIQEFKLTKDNCVIFCRDKLDIPNATLVLEDSVDTWVRTLWPTIKDIPMYTAPFSKKFAVWFHRGTFYRLAIARQLYENYRNDSFISYQERGMLCDLPFIKYFQDDINWANANTPIIYDKLFPNRVYDHEMIVGASRKPYDQYFMEIVVETDCVSNTWLTEKTIKNLYLGKPFLIMGAPYSLKHLHSHGFKTFDKWFDESYDTVTNNYERLELIKREIDKIGQMSIDEVNSMFNDMIPVLEYNRNRFLEIKPDYV